MFYLRQGTNIFRYSEATKIQDIHMLSEKLKAMYRLIAI